MAAASLCYHAPQCPWSLNLQIVIACDDFLCLRNTALSNCLLSGISVQSLCRPESHFIVSTVKGRRCATQQFLTEIGPWSSEAWDVWKLLITDHNVLSISSHLSFVGGKGLESSPFHWHQYAKPLALERSKDDRRIKTLHSYSWSTRVEKGDTSLFKGKCLNKTVWAILGLKMLVSITRTKKRLVIAGNHPFCWAIILTVSMLR